ncbi:MAG: hypothetical protein IK126_12090 [Bacteroidales bacterium]|nr:hypothetical protein [Bacteroidales bacterium]
MEKNTKGLEFLLHSKTANKRIKELQEVCSNYEKKQKILITLALSLFYKRKSYVDTLTSLPNKLSKIDNLPSWCNEDIAESLENIKEFQMAVEYEESPKEFAVKTDKTGRTEKIIRSTAATGKEKASIAMAIATAVGTTTTGTAISALSSAAATNAALAWLSGGAVAAGGAGIVGGSIALGLFGPIGMAAVGMGTISGIIFTRIKNKNKIIEVEKYIDVIKHDNEVLEPKLQHLSELIDRSDNNYIIRLKGSLEWLDNVHPKDYQQWDDNQKHDLERLINAASNTVQLINERV